MGLDDLKSKTVQEIEPRLKKFYETLNNKPEVAALELKELLGTVEVKSAPGECAGENGQLIANGSYYVVHTSIQTVSLLDEEF